MPTVAWISESADKAREWGGHGVVPKPGPPQISCPHCSFATTSRRAFFAHVSTQHVGDRPVLFIKGEEPHRSQKLYSVLEANSIKTSGATGVRAWVNGSPISSLGMDNLGTFLAGLREGNIEIELENRYQQSARPLLQSYRLELLVPSSTSLDKVDRLFVEHLADAGFDFESIGRFLKAVPVTRAANWYAASLADYARGVLIKDRPAHVSVTVNYAEYRKLFRSAESVLRHFDRPIPRLVCGIVRFALNDLKETDRLSGFAPLDATALYLGALIGGRGRNLLFKWPSAEGGGGEGVPLDEGVSRVISLATRLGGLGKWTGVVEEECRQAAEASTLDLFDRHKILALWAGAALRLGIESAAQEPLAQLSASFPFDQWASREREREQS